MFDNLVESGSHKDDLARKSSFLFGTLIVYLILGTVMSSAASCWPTPPLKTPVLSC